MGLSISQHLCRCRYINGDHWFEMLCIKIGSKHKQLPYISRRVIKSKQEGCSMKNSPPLSRPQADHDLLFLIPAPPGRFDQCEGFCQGGNKPFSVSGSNKEPTDLFVCIQHGKSLKKQKIIVKSPLETLIISLYRHQLQV